MEGAVHAVHQVKRTVSLILIDPATGIQTRVGGATRSSPVSAASGSGDPRSGAASDAARETTSWSCGSSSRMVSSPARLIMSL